MPALLLATRLLLASRTRTVTGGVIVAPPVMLVGCCPNASLVGAPNTTSVPFTSILPFPWQSAPRTARRVNGYDPGVTALVVRFSVREKFAFVVVGFGVVIEAVTPAGSAGDVRKLSVTVQFEVLPAIVTSIVLDAVAVGCMKIVDGVSVIALRLPSVNVIDRLRPLLRLVATRVNLTSRSPSSTV